MNECVVRKADISDARGIALVHIASSDDTYAPLAAEWQSDDEGERTARWAKILSEQNRLVMIAEGQRRSDRFRGRRSLLDATSRPRSSRFTPFMSTQCFEVEALGTPFGTLLA